ncbi:hypothetical protein QTP88_014884 [Uroleucon formosanum]
MEQSPNPSAEDAQTSLTETVANTITKHIIPPPIFIKGVDDFPGVCTELIDLIGVDNFHCKSSADRLKIQTANPESYRALVQFLRKENAEFHTYQLQEDKPIRVVIRNIHPTTPCELIKEELVLRLFEVRQVTPVLHRLNKNPLPLFFVDLEPTTHSNEIFQLTSLLHTKIIVEEPYKPKSISQCVNCQDYGHTKAYCGYSPRCVRCENHPASYKGCAVYKNLQRHKNPNTINNNKNLSVKTNYNLKSKNVQDSHPPNSSMHLPAQPLTYADETSGLSPKPTPPPLDPVTPPSATDINTLLTSFLSEFKTLLNPLISLLTKAFDRVWHDGLLYKLRNFLPPSLFLLTKSYPTDRYFQIRIETCTSQMAMINAGVPQGGILSPLLFNIYASDQPITENTIVADYADDKALISIHENPLIASDYPDLTNNRKETQNNVPVLLNNCLIGQPNDDAELELTNPDIESSIAIEMNSAASSEVVTRVPSAYKELNDLGNDPAILSKIENIDPGLISYFLKIGAAQPLPCELPDKQFPRDHNGRSFHESWYWNKRSTGEVLQRKWLSYSIKNKKIYCLYCALFARNNKPNWTRHGFSNWNKGTTSIIMHETSEAHIMASIKAAYRQAEYPLIQSMKESVVANIAFNKEIVKHLIDLTYLGRHSLPFRGHREGWQENIRGNYKDLVLLLAKYSPALTSYVTSVELKGRKTYNFISWQRQNQLIEAIYRNIYDVIKKEILTAVFFSISLDTTFDVSQKEDGTVCERLVDLHWRANLVGQSYDGAASMKGSYNGLQSLVKKENPCAVYVWCWAHRFNLVVVDAVSCCIEARDLFGYLETLYDFIGSKFQVLKLEAYLQEIFPTMYTALSIAVTLPVSSASPERAFSKLKLVKTRLRSTMSEDRLEALMIMACELDVQIDTECVIKYFASNSSVLAKLLT